MSQLIHKSEILARVKRVVIKVGSAVVSEDSGLRASVIEELAAQIDGIVKGGLSVVLVSSGAIAAGRARIAAAPARSMAARQAAAAVGQIELMAQWARHFSQHSRTVAQVLLTHQDLAERHRRTNAKQTIDMLLEHGVVPIVNENDTVAVEEIRFGDNDNLSALVANLVQAQVLVILSDVAGVLTGDPRKREDARLIPLITDAESEMKGLVAESAGPLGTGGMASKLKAARQAARAGIAVMIASGLEPAEVAALFDPKREAGTLILPHSTRLKSRKHWIAFALKPSGTLTLDRGASEALRQKGKSLLASGIRAVSGEFSGGDCVSIVDADGGEFGRGLVNYPSADVIRIKGKRSSEIAPILGYKVADEIVHRDNLVLL